MPLRRLVLAQLPEHVVGVVVTPLVVLTTAVEWTEESARAAILTLMPDAAQQAVVDIAQQLVELLP